MGPTFWLTIAPTKQSELYDVTLVGCPPTAEAQTIQLRRTQLWSCIMAAKEVAHPKNTGLDVRTVYGNALASWLFGDHSDTSSAPTIEQIAQWLRQGAPAVPLNPIGLRLQNEAKVAEAAQASSRIRLFVHVKEALFFKEEFLYFSFFQSLSANQLVPLDAWRSVWKGQDAAAQELVAHKQPVADQLNVLLVVSNPKDHPLNVGDETFRLLKNELDPLAAQHALHLSLIEQPLIGALEAKLQPPDPRDSPHIFIFLGHGYHNSSSPGTGVSLGCVDENGLEKPWNCSALQEILREQKNHANLRLVIFLACQSFVAAPALLSLGIPAVIGMQPYLFSLRKNGPEYDFPTDRLMSFAKPLFEALAQFEPITTAFQKGVDGLRDGLNPDVHDQLRVAPVMPALWLANQTDQLFIAGPKRLKRLYQDALLSKIMRCEWPGRDNVTIDKVFVDPPLWNLGTDSKSTCDKILELLSSGQAVALEGPEWSGKTTVAHWVVSQVFQSEKIPILIDGRAMKTAKQTLEQWVLTSCRDRLGLMVYQDVTNLIMQAYQAGNAVLVIDDGDPHWLTEPPHALKQHLREEQQPTNTSPILVTVSEGAHASDTNWTRLHIEPLHPKQQTTLVGRYGKAVSATPTTETFLQRVGDARQQPNGVTTLAGRPGFLVDMLAQFLRQEVLLTNEADLLARRQQHHWNKPIASASLSQPDEPVYKQRLLEALGFHLYCCRQGRDKASDAKAIMEAMLNAQSLYAPEPAAELLNNEQPNNRSEQASELLQEFVEARPFLRHTAKQGWMFRSPEWLRFSAASQIASLVNARDKAVLAWLTEDGRSITCRLCQTKLAPFTELVDPVRGDDVRQAVAAALAEDLPAWRRDDPWDCPAILELRRVLVRTLRLPPAAITHSS